MDATRPRWVIAELDARGEIDDHAAMCLRFAIEHAGAAGRATILVDLRELTAIDAGRLELFLAHDAECRAGGAELAILICADLRQETIVRAFTAVGLGDRLQFAYQPAAPPRNGRRRTATVRWHRRAATARP
jgi:anti-anti-sigma regulatory factor